MSIFDDPGLFGRLWAERYDVGPELDPVPTVDFLAGLAAGGPVLELAIGTGQDMMDYSPSRTENHDATRGGGSCR